MNVDESLAVLKADLGCSSEEREQAYTSAREGILLEISTAPTPALKARYQRKLNEVEAAYAMTKSVSNVNLPKTISGSVNPLSEPHSGFSTVNPARLPPPTVEMLPDAGDLAEAGPRHRLIRLGIGALALLFIFGSVLLIVCNGVKTKSADTHTAKTPSVPAPASISSVVSQPKTLAVTTERQDYQNGEDVVCLVDIPFDGHLRVYSVDVRGAKNQIFPNGFETNGEVRAGMRVRIPGSSDYTLKLGLPPGSKGGDETVVAVLSPTPFEGVPQPSTGNPFPAIETSINLKTRGLSPQSLGNTANGTGVYRVRP